MQASLTRTILTMPLHLWALKVGIHLQFCSRKLPYPCCYTATSPPSFGDGSADKTLLGLEPPAPASQLRSSCPKILAAQSHWLCIGRGSVPLESLLQSRTEAISLSLRGGGRGSPPPTSRAGVERYHAFTWEWTRTAGSNPRVWLACTTALPSHKSKHARWHFLGRFP